jgi:tRNA-specific 2-thiouridylase
MLKKILVAMSGGVDSSVAALLLKKRGFEVIGIFMNFWSENKKDSSNKCCSIESARIARVIAARLGIKFYELNYKTIFKKKVVDYFIRQYEQARTPNPCAVCNREIKFGRLLKVAQNLGATKIATGHYARIIKKGKKFELYRGVDKNKDQSYFLWQLPLSSLSSIEFPVGHLMKSKVRQLAKEYKLITYNKKDSQGLCFIGESNASFLKKHAKNLLHPGNVVNKSGEVIGRHQGLAFYTIGQRAGFITDKDGWRKSQIDVPPLYVIKLMPIKNLLLVGEDQDVWQKKLVAGQINWLSASFDHFTGRRKVLAQVRYQHQAKPCIVSYLNQKNISLTFEKPERAITPGQSCVFYQKDRLLGGGIIQ